MGSDKASFPHSGDVLGTKVAAVDLEAAVETIVGRTQGGKGGYVCLCNVHVVATAQRDPSLAAALDDAWLNLPDGAPVAWTLRRGGHNAGRVPGPDLVAALIDAGRRAHLRHFFFGGNDALLEALSDWVMRAYPDALVCGRLAPPIGEPDALGGALLDEIVMARPDVIWCGLGAPKQEIWMHQNWQYLRPAVVVGVGAAFAFHAGVQKRAPRWMQHAGLEWFHRLAREPRRLGWRYLSTNTLFGLALLGGTRFAADPAAKHVVVPRGDAGYDNRVSPND